MQTSHGPSCSTAVRWIAVAAWAVLIFAASAHTGEDLNSGNDWLGQIKQQLDLLLARAAIPGLEEASSLGHFGEYTVFGALLAFAWRKHAVGPWVFLLALACGSLYGVTDEIHQMFVPGRYCDPADWAVDTAGTALGALLCLALARARGRAAK